MGITKRQRTARRANRDEGGAFQKSIEEDNGNNWTDLPTTDLDRGDSPEEEPSHEILNKLTEVISLEESRWRARGENTNCELCFAFDNSQAHHKAPDDGLDASKLPMKCGGKHASSMRDEWSG